MDLILIIYFLLLNICKILSFEHAISVKFINEMFDILFVYFVVKVWCVFYIDSSSRFKADTVEVLSSHIGWWLP